MEEGRAMVMIRREPNTGRQTDTHAGDRHRLLLPVTQPDKP